MRENMIALKTYFCPRCGNGYESAEANRGGKLIPVWPRCPACGKPLQVSGSAFIVFGVLIWMCFGTVLDTTTPLLGAIIGAVFGIFGLVRLLRQAHARRSTQPGAAPKSGSNTSDGIWGFTAITRILNLILAGGITRLTFSALFGEGRHFDWTTVLFPLVVVCWSAGAVGLFFNSRLAWCGSLLGLGTMAASSLAITFTAWRVTPTASDPTDGIGYMMMIGIGGLLVSLPMIVGLIRIRKTCFRVTA